MTKKETEERQSRIIENVLEGSREEGRKRQERGLRREEKGNRYVSVSCAEVWITR